MTLKPMNEKDWKNIINPETVYNIAHELVDYGVKSVVDMMTMCKCTGNRKFNVINPSGEVYPCSFVRKSQGNVLEEDFKEIWENRTIPKCPYLINNKR
jgi:MoaA/NifB/PqqE/SkfB family radical SAM enzyme